MKSIMNGKRIFPMLAILVLSLFAVTGCKDDNREPDQDINDPEIPALINFDDLEWFAGNLVLTDPEGNLTEYMRGRVLDPATPQTLYIGVDTEAEAAQIFKEWLAPESESRLAVAQDGSMTYSPTDEEGNSQGEIYYKKCTTEEDAIATVTFSKEAAIDYVKEVKFISNDLWPENADFTSPYSLGEIVDFDTDYDDRRKLYGWQKAVCIREASRDEAGLIVYISDKKVLGGKSYPMAAYRLGPRPDMAQTIARIINRDWDFFASAYESAGTTLSDTDYYWLGEFWLGVTTVENPYNICQWAIQLKTNHLGLLTAFGQKHEPRPIIMYRTFNATAE